MSQMPTSARAAVGSMTPRSSSPGHTPHVLVADANPASRQEREQHLKGAGARVVTARTGFEAIVKASCQMPDLIVLDESLGDVEVAETARLLTIRPVTRKSGVPVSPPRGRGPLGAPAALRRRIVV